MAGRDFRTVAVALLALAGGTSFGDEPPSGGPRPAPISPRFMGPRTGPEKPKALAKYGGDSSTEKAVEAGLQWLARHQQEDGFWDADGFPARCEASGPKCSGVGKGQHGEEGPCPFDAAISGLVTLAFLGAGHGPWVAGDPHGATVEKALTRLRGGMDVWGNAIAARAFADAEAMEGKGRWLADAKGAAEALLAARSEDGAWGYFGGAGRGSDVPYTALVVPALVAAKDVGVALPASLAADVDKFLESLEVDDGKLAYVVSGRQFGYTPTAANALAAAAVREWLEVGRSGKRHRSHLAVAAKDKPDWSISWKDITVPGRGKMRVQVGHLSLYEWWYGTEAAFQSGGDLWSGWFSRLKTALVPHQKTSGCARGSWDPEGTYERQTGGRVFATALAVLMLETPYRQRRLAGP